MSARFVKNLETFLFKKQATYGTAETELTASDFVEVLDGSQLAVTIDSEEIKVVGPGFDQLPSVPGRETGELTLVFPLRSFGTGVLPDFDGPLQCCDMTATDSTTGYYIYTPTLNGVDGCAWNFYGHSGTSNLDKVSNFKGSFKISLEAGKPARLEITGPCAYNGLSTGTVPTVTRNRSHIPAVLGATVSINGSAYKFISAEFDANQSAELDVDASASNGCGQGNITERAIKWSAKVYADSQSTLDPIAAIRASTEAATSFSWGSGAEVKIDAAYTQITDCKKSDQNGVTTWDLNGQCNRNDFSLSIKG
jgi:hypothetical protein